MLEEWKAAAACRGLPADLFYPEREEGADNHGGEGKQICADCPVRSECLDHSVRVNYEKHGIWGGVSGGRRAALRQIFRQGNLLEYQRALVEETLEIGRAVVGYEDERVETPERPCDRCDAMVPAGIHPVDRNSDQATCDRASTYNRGCRCTACSDAKRRYYAESKKGKRSPRGESATVKPPAPEALASRRRTAP